MVGRPLAADECIERIPVGLAELGEGRRRAGGVGRPGLKDETPLGLLEPAGAGRHGRA